MLLDQSQLSQIDQSLASGEGKRAEVQVARLLRSTLPSVARAQLLVRRARARLLTERPDEALEDLQTCYALAPEFWTDPNILELSADAYFSRFELAPVGFAERADADRACELYARIAEQYPDYPNLGWVMYQWGRALLSDNKIDEAVAKIQEALLKPSTVRQLTALCYERLGFIYLNDKRDPANALAFFERAANTYPAGEPAGWVVRLHLLRSRAYRDQGEFESARQAAQLALATLDSSEPDYRATLSDTHLALGEILAGIPGREREAVEHLQQFLQQSRRPQGVDVTWSRIHETLGELWFRLERYDSAVDAYRTALAYNPYHPWEMLLYYQIARCHYRLREYEKAINSIERMLELATAEHQPITDYRVYGVLANAHFALEHYAEACEAYRQAVELAPPQAENLEKLTTYYRFAQELARRA